MDTSTTGQSRSAEFDKGANHPVEVSLINPSSEEMAEDERRYYQRDWESDE